MHSEDEKENEQYMEWNGSRYSTHSTDQEEQVREGKTFVTKLRDAFDLI